VQAIPGGSAGGSLPTLSAPGAPALTVKPGVPSPSLSEDDDMAELRGMKKDAKGGWRKWAVGSAGLLLGGLLGFLIGGPIGLAVGAALLGGGAFLGARYLWG
jgi:hypothetical protein